MARVTVDEDGAAMSSRPTAIRLVEMTLRGMETWRQRVGDYDSAMVMLAVVAISSSRLLRVGLEPELRDMTRPVPPDLLGKCTFSSIAAATGLHRETTRRKVAQLVKRGFLERSDSEGVRFPSGYLQTPGTAALVRSQLDLFVRTANELLRDGVITIE